MKDIKFMNLNEERASANVELIKELIRKAEDIQTVVLELAIDAGIIDAIAGRTVVIEPYFIINLVEKKLGVNVTKRDRKKETVEARQVAIYLLRKYCRLSLMRIAQYVALADHSGVLHHLKVIEGYISIDDRIAVLIEQFEQDIINHFEKMKNEGNAVQELQGN